MNLSNDIISYCGRYGIPINHFLEIINDQKVVPMIRGKGTEFAVLDLLKHSLSSKEWRVEKSNLNPQPGHGDEDIVIINLETSIRIIAESKNAVRGSFSLGTRLTPKPHFKVKCHKSRSFLGRETNDKYFDTEFDLLFTNPSNSLILSGEDFDMISISKVVSHLRKFYKTRDQEAIFQNSNHDWRFAIASEISTNGIIPRTPVVLMENDPHWATIEKLGVVLEEALDQKVKRLVRARHDSS